VLHGVCAGALADAGERHFALVAVEQGSADLDQLVVRERAVDLRDHGVGEAFAAQLEDRIEIVRARLERLEFGWCHVLSGLAVAQAAILRQLDLRLKPEPGFAALRSGRAFAPL
jgi:hypothetical protein